MLSPFFEQIMVAGKVVSADAHDSLVNIDKGWFENHGSTFGGMAQYGKIRTSHCSEPDGLGTVRILTSGTQMVPRVHSRPGGN